MANLNSLFVVTHCYGVSDMEDSFYTNDRKEVVCVFATREEAEEFVETHSLDDPCSVDIDDEQGEVHFPLHTGGGYRYAGILEIEEVPLGPPKHLRVSCWWLFPKFVHFK